MSAGTLPALLARQKNSLIMGRGTCPASANKALSSNSSTTKKKKDLKQQQKYLQKQLREELGPEPDLQTGASAGQGSAQPPVPLN
jgi:hypothetical protein